jgi:hypothetical protein
MATAEPDGTPAPGSQPGQRGFLASVKGALFRTEQEFAFLKGITLLSIIGTLIGAYFQNLSAYEDKVTTQAKEDMTAATEAFTDASTALSTAITLQGLLFYDFTRAAKLNAVSDDNGLMSKNARELYKPYEEAAATLHESVNMLARRMEIYLDWPSDPSHDPTSTASLGVDPITSSMLGTVNFDCDEDMPSFAPNKSSVTREANGRKLTVDWFSAKHHVFTIEYCFDVTRKAWMETIRQWASQSSLDPAAVDKFFADGTAGKLQTRLDEQVVRLNAFMSRAMSEIDAIRARYRPNGYLCSVPILNTLVDKKCTPVRTRS